jgi:HK97 family phage major capsid protein
MKTTEQSRALRFFEPIERATAVEGTTPADGVVVDDKGRIKVIVSTENPVEQTPGVIEILGHKPSEIDMTYAKNGLSLLLEHGRNSPWDRIDPDKHLGIVDDITRDAAGKRLIGWATFDDTPRAQEIKNAVLKRTRRFTSVGAAPLAKDVSTPKKAGDPTTIRYTRWQPFELTITSIPADPGGLIGRSAGEGHVFTVEVESLEPEGKEESSMESKTTTAAPTGTTTTEPKLEVITRSAALEQVTDRNKVAAQIVTLCRSYNVPDKAGDFIERNLTLDQAKLEIFEGLSSGGGRVPASEQLEGLTRKDRKRYRYRRAIALQLGIKEGGGKLDGLEGEVHQHLLRRKPQGATLTGGILVPFDMRDQDEIDQDFEERQTIERTMDSKTAGKGAELVAAISGQLIELLESQPIAGRLGANIMAGLTAPITFPRETGAPTVTFKGENPGVDITDDDASTGELELALKSMRGSVKMSRELLVQTSGRAEGMVKNRLTTGHARAIDRAVFHGTGAGSQPTGLYNLAGVLAVAMGSVAPTYVKITDMEGLVADQAVEAGAFGFALTARMAARLKSTLMFPGTSSPPIFAGKIQGGEIDGYTAIGSPQVRSNLGAGADEHGFAFGAWDMCVIGLFGALELLVDPYTLGGQGLIRVRSYSYGDVIFTHPEAFCVGTAAKLA